MQKLKQNRRFWVEVFVGVACAILLLIPLLGGKKSKEGEEPSPTASSGQAQATHYDPPASDMTLDVYFHQSKEHKTMQLEEYLVGVVAGEMPATYEPEALKAQAVAARTYTYQKKLTTGCKSGADICTYFGCCQAYSDTDLRKKTWKDEYDAKEEKIRQSIYATAGQILVYEGEPIQAFFHSSSGGMTEDVEHVFGDSAVPYLRAVESGGEEDGPRFTREVSMTAAEFVKGIKKIAPKAELSADTLAQSIGEPKRFASGRIESITIGGASLTGRQVRTAFDLDSANFTITVADGQVKIKTQGFGHGVGLSQVGANTMAKKGNDYKDILLHYYTGVELSKITN